MTTAQPGATRIRGSLPLPAIDVAAGVAPCCGGSLVATTLLGANAWLTMPALIDWMVLVPLAAW